MGNEAVIIELLGDAGNPIRFTCDNANPIPKGTLLELTDPRTVTVTAADDDPFGGIAASEKVASDGSTTIAAYQCGIFDLKDSGAGFAAGDRVNVGGANLVIISVADADNLLQCVGIALETAGAGDVVAVLIGSGL